MIINRLRCLVWTLVAGSVLVFSGCETKEKVLDIETPGGEVEVTKDRDDGTIDVDVDTE